MQRNNLFYYFKQQRSLVVAFCFLFFAIALLPLFILFSKIKDRMWRNNEFRTNRNSNGNSI